MDSGGVYWPDRRDPEDIMLPAPDDHLCVTDSWVIFARPKGASEYLRDLDALFGKVSSATDLPEAVAQNWSLSHRKRLMINFFPVCGDSRYLS